MDADFYKEWFCQLLSCSPNPSFYTWLCNAGGGTLQTLFPLCQVLPVRLFLQGATESHGKLKKGKETCFFLFASYGPPVLVTITLAMLHSCVSVLHISAPAEPASLCPLWKYQALQKLQSLMSHQINYCSFKSLFWGIVCFAVIITKFKITTTFWPEGERGALVTNNTKQEEVCAINSPS